MEERQIMIKYGDLVKYIKKHHVNWNTDLFDVLRGFFEEYSQPFPSSTPSIQQELVFPDTMKEASSELSHEDFQAPADGEYSTSDLINLFST